MKRMDRVVGVILGIVSDSHDRVEALRAGIDALRNAGATYFIHCGDIGGQGAINVLAGLDGVAVWGNTDWDRAALGRYAESIGVRIRHPLADVQLDSARIAVLHGDDGGLMRRLISSGDYDYLFCGHTHVPEDRTVGRTRIINPGALHRARVKTIASLDLDTGERREIVIA